MKPNEETTRALTVPTTYQVRRVKHIPPLPANDQLERDGWRFAVDRRRQVIYYCKLESDLKQ